MRSTRKGSAEALGKFPNYRAANLLLHPPSNISIGAGSRAAPAVSRREKDRSRPHVCCAIAARPKAGCRLRSNISTGAGFQSSACLSFSLRETAGAGAPANSEAGPEAERHGWRESRASAEANESSVRARSFAFTRTLSGPAGHPLPAGEGIPASGTPECLLRDYGAATGWLQTSMGGLRWGWC
jgi:hypothetical protein